jgi:hypothetical protein
MRERGCVCECSISTQGHNIHSNSKRLCLGRQRQRHPSLYRVCLSYSHFLTRPQSSGFSFLIPFSRLIAVHLQCLSKSTDYRYTLYVLCGVGYCNLCRHGLLCPALQTVDLLKNPISKLQDKTVHRHRTTSHHHATPYLTLPCLILWSANPTQPHRIQQQLCQDTVAF